MKIEVVGHLDTRRLPDGRRELLADLIIFINDVQHTIPKGFVTDYSSFPWAFRWIVRWSKVDIAGVFHDWLYREGMYSRKYSDKLWYAVATAGETSANKYQAGLSYLGLRMGGWTTWRKYRKLDNAAY